MIEDDIIWEIIRDNHCSFKTKTETQSFCRNEYNVSGLCNRRSCPLSNSRYATIKEESGTCILYIKTAERAHTPNKLWEGIKLDKSYKKALEQIDSELEYWPKFMIHKNKQRLTKIRQMLIRMRKIRNQVTEKLVPIKQKTERREMIRELEGEKAAQLEKAIEKELLNRLKQGLYKHPILNVNKKAYINALDKLEEVNTEDYEYDVEEEEEGEGDSDVESLDESDLGDSGWDIEDLGREIEPEVEIETEVFEPELIHNNHMGT